MTQGLTASVSRLARHVWLFSILPMLAGVLLLVHWRDVGPLEIAWGLLIIALVTLVTTALAVRALIVRPLQLALSMVYRITEGDFGVRSDVADAGELATLVGALNDLAGIVENRLGSLQAAEHRHRLLYDQNPAGLFRTRVDGRVLECNAAAVRILGYDTATEVKTHNARTFFANPDERAEVLERLAKDRVLSSVPMHFRAKDGHELPVLTSMVLLEDHGDVSIDGMFLPSATVAPA
jgi:PAS domain S-box-containing protein